MPELEKARQQLEPQGVRFLALSLEPDDSIVAKAAGRYGLQMDVAVAEGEVLGPLHVGSIPATIFIRDGVIVGAADGERGEAFFRKSARELFGTH